MRFSCVRERIASLAGILFAVCFVSPALSVETTTAPPSHSAAAASDNFSTNSHWMRDPHSGCWIFYRWDFDAITDIAWSGQCTDSRASGAGTLTITRARKTETFTGNFANGQLEGDGAFVTSDGARLEGEYHQGALNGKGTATWPSGMHYEGEFRNQRFAGNGKLTWPGGDSYEGQIWDGPIYGEGKLIYTDGWQFRGNFSGVDPVGDMIVYRPDGSRIEGDFVPPHADNNFNPTFSSNLLKPDEHARVELRYTITVDVAVKDIVLTVPSDFPELNKAATDAVAAWRFKPATVNGANVEYKPSEQFTFAHGTREWRDGGHYEGQLINNEFDGQGSVTWPGGDRYVGTFSRGLEYGHGTFTEANGDIYEGSFVAGAVSGHAVLRRANGTRLEGEFVPPAIDTTVPMPAVQYPPIAVRQNRQGSVTLRYRVETDGTIRDVRILYYSGTQELDDEAVAEVFRTKMIPGTLNGKSIALDAVRRVEFRLQ